MSGRETVQPEVKFVAYVGIDWADQKHVWSLQAAGSTERESGELEHKPETVEAWVSELCRRFGQGPIAVAVEQVKVGFDVMVVSLVPTLPPNYSLQTCGVFTVGPLKSKKAPDIFKAIRVDREINVRMYD